MLRRLTVILGAVLMSACQQGYDFDIPQTNDVFSGNIQYNRKVDVIFVMDNSLGIASHKQKLLDQIPGLVNSLVSLNLDLHIAMITSSMGGVPHPDGGHLLGSPNYFTSQTPNLASELVNRLTNAGSEGSPNERGLDSLVQVLSPGYQSSEGNGFLRADAPLAVISLSTEDDNSADLSSGSLAAYSSYLDTAKGTYEDGTRRWMMNFIGLLSLSESCYTTPETHYREPGLRWIELAAMSGGVSSSICSSSFANAVANVRARIVSVLRDFPLKQKPLIDTIHVFIDGSEVPRSSVNGWDYIEASNTIRLYGSAIPSETSSVRIDFKPAEAN